MQLELAPQLHLLTSLSPVIIQQQFVIEEKEAGFIVCPYLLAGGYVLMNREMRIRKEGDWLNRARRFDLQALAEVYDYYSPKLYAYAIRLLGDAELSEECVAETFSRFLHTLRTGKGPQDYLQAYLYRVAHNYITDQYRCQPLPDLSLDIEPVHDHENLPELLAAEESQRRQVRAALFRLTPDQRQVVMLKFIEGWENEEIAEILNKPVGAVKSLQHRALQALRRMLLTTEEEEYEAIRAIT